MIPPKQFQWDVLSLTSRSSSFAWNQVTSPPFHSGLVEFPSCSCMRFTVGFGRLKLFPSTAWATSEPSTRLRSAGPTATTSRAVRPSSTPARHPPAIGGTDRDHGILEVGDGLIAQGVRDPWLVREGCG